MRDLILSIAISLGFILGISSARGSILVLNWIWFQRPYDFSDGLWNTKPLFLVALGIAVLSNLLHKQFHPRFPPILLVFLALLCWITISSVFSYDSKQAWLTYRNYLPSMWITPILLFGTIHDLRLLRSTLWIAAGSIGINACKTGVSLLAQGGVHITKQISGFVGDNNVFGLVLCMVVAILIGLRTTLPERRWIRSLLFLIVAFIVLTIIYTKSRGALISMGIIALLGCILGNRPFRDTLLLIFIIIGGYLAVPSEYFDRLSTIDDLSSDVSAMGRFENWGLSWNEALKYPILGVGPENHLIYNLAISPDVQVRVAHSVYFQVLGELGFPGLGIYFLFVLMGLRSLFNTWRAMIPIVSKNPNMAWVRDTAFWMMCGYVGYIIGSGFLNMLWIEFPWYAIFYGSMLHPLVKKELSKI